MDGETRMDDLAVTLSEHFQNGNGEAAKKLILDTSEKQLKFQAWDLVPVICQYVTQELNSEDPNTVIAAEEILVQLTSAANIKEMLIVLLEQVDTPKDDTRFKGLLLPIQQCILKLPGKKGSTIGVALETLYGHLRALPLPEDRKLEGKERVVLEIDETVCRCADVVLAFLDFLEPIVEEYKWQKRQNVDNNLQKHISKVALDITKYLIKILDHPLGYLDLSHRSMDENEKFSPMKTTTRECAEKLMLFLSLLQNNFPQAICDLYDQESRMEHSKKQKKVKKLEKKSSGSEEDDESDLDVEERTSMLGLSVFSYLAFGEILAPDSIPQVFSHEFLLDLNCGHITFMLEQKENLVVFKGVTMFSNLVSRLESASLSGNVLELPGVKDLLQALFMVMTSAKVKELAQSSVTILRDILDRFDLGGRHQLLYYVMNTAKHMGLMGLAITLLKDQIDNQLRAEKPDENFTGAKLKRLFKFIFTLPGGAESDLLDQNDRIMATLNLLRYLVIRDKPSENITLIWDEIDSIKTTYCEELHKGIKISRAHYQMELQKTRETKKGKKRGDLTFTVQDREMPGLNKQQQLEVLQMATHTLDMMDSILARVTEVIDQQHREAAQ